MTAYEPRFGKVAKIASLFLLEHNIDKLPVDSIKIISQHKNWVAKSYDKYANRHSISIEEVIEFAENEDGCVQVFKDRYLILYNDNPAWIDSPKRINWTIMHEIGHIVLDHFDELKNNTISNSTINDEKYEQLEKEAHYFAACVLAPHIISYKLKIKDAKTLSNICGITGEASEKRFSAYKKWLKLKKYTSNDLLILKNFSTFSNLKKCTRCNWSLEHKFANYCPICANKLIWGIAYMKYNDGYELDEYSKAIICPKCENKDISEEARHCKICGIYLINKCTGIYTIDEVRELVSFKEGCGNLADGNARFCIHCGNPTTYYENNLLEKWEIAREILFYKLHEEGSEYEVPF